LTLFETASETVRLKFEPTDRAKADLVREMVKQAADQIQTKLRDHSEKYATARAYVEQLHKSGELSEAQVCKFAELRKFDETAAAMSLLMDLPIGAVERALVHDTGDQILVLAKSIDFSWKRPAPFSCWMAASMPKNTSIDIRSCGGKQPGPPYSSIDCANAPRKRRRSSAPFVVAK
jgi:Uncharacterised protein conserved in bacteria (DUF2336)